MGAQPEASAIVDLLVVDDDPESHILLTEMLGQGYGVVIATTSGQALELLRLRRFPLALVDVRLPDLSGLDLLPRLRALDPHMGVILITAYGDVGDAVRALRDLQAMDYIQKPFSSDELRQRVTRALDILDEQRRLTLGDLTLDRQARQVRRNGTTLALTRRDVELLLYLARHKDRTVGYEELVRQVWGNEPLPLHEQKIRNAISRLRRKLAAGSDGRAYIYTVWGRGYKTEDQGSLSALDEAR